MWEVLVIKKSVIDNKNLRFDESIRIGEDADWVFRATLETIDVKIIHRAGYVYRVSREGSAMTVKSVESILSLFMMTERWGINAKNNPNLYPIYLLFCNNAMDYLQLLYIYDHDGQKRILEGLHTCGAYNDSNSRFAVKAKRDIEKNGINITVSKLKLKHLIKRYGSCIKRKARGWYSLFSRWNR